MIETNKKVVLNCILYIHYLIWFKIDQDKTCALINSGNEINAMTLTCVAKLDLKIQSTNVDTQKIYGFIFQIFKIFVASFQVENKFKKS